MNRLAMIVLCSAVFAAPQAHASVLSFLQSFSPEVTDCRPAKVFRLSASGKRYEFSPKTPTVDRHPEWRLCAFTMPRNHCTTSVVTTEVWDNGPKGDLHDRRTYYARVGDWSCPGKETGYYYNNYFDSIITLATPVPSSRDVRVMLILTHVEDI
jgi:hypothetical protein